MSDRTHQIAARIAEHHVQASNRAAKWAGTDEWYTLNLGRDTRGWFFATDVLKNGKYKGFQVTWWDDRRVPDKAKITAWMSQDLRGRTVSEGDVPPKVVARVQARL